MNTKTNKNGFTLAELLTAIVIIAILIGILLPALNMARNFAKTTRQKVQLSSIDVGINMFKNDTGEYPRSHGKDTAATPYDYYGAETLAEAMFGCDLMGFHPKSEFDKTANYNGTTVYNAGDTTGKNLKDRKGLYIDRTNLGVFQLGDIFTSSSSDTAYVICDTFDAVSRDIPISGGTKRFKVGTPILYFRANTAGLDISTSTATADRIYDYQDNKALVDLGTVKDGTAHLDFTENTVPKNFLTYIEDPVATAGTRIRPVRPDSFLLISAGQDGLYGTTDDICNFEQNIQ